MTAPMSSTLGSAVPPAGGPQGGAQRRRVANSVGNPGAIPGSGRWAADAVDCTYRQLDWWVRKGFLGAHNQDLGQGRRRRFDDVDLEVMVALRNLAALGATEEWLQLGAETVRAERVKPGEWLLVTIAHHALRGGLHDFPRVIHDWDARRSAWLVPLQAFDQGRPE